jgi:hypothetical protein
MPSAELIKKAAPFVVLIGGVGFVWLADPLDWFDGLMLFFWGLVGGRWIEQLSPSPRQDEEGPLLPWNEMHASEKFGYFMPAIFLAVMALISFIATVIMSRLAFDWRMAGIAVFFLGMAVFSVVWKWSHRLA